MVSSMIPREELNICSICYSTYSGKECVFSSNISHRTKRVEELKAEIPEIESIEYMENTTGPMTAEQLKTLLDLLRTLSIAISLVGEMVNHFQEAMQILVPTLQRIQTLAQELHDGKKDSR